VRRGATSASKTARMLFQVLVSGAEPVDVGLINVGLAVRA
jgi:hypothetical protein